MPRSDASSKPVFFLPYWVRIGVACVMFAVTVLYVWKGFFHFEWVGWLCFGLYYLLYVPRQKGEPAGAYFKKPRTVASLALITTALVGFGYYLRLVFTK